MRNIIYRERSSGLWPFCQWDDDDWYHPYGIESQLYFIRQMNSDVVILTKWILCDLTQTEAYLIQFAGRYWERSSIFIAKEVTKM